VIPKGYAISSQGIRESISVITTNLKFDILLKIIAELLQLPICLFLMTRFVIKKISVPKKVKIIQRVITYATGMYSQVSQITSGI
jgi:hypothetical protein